MIEAIIRPRWVSIEAASFYCSVSRATVYRLIEREDIVASSIGSRRLIDLDSIDDYLARRRGGLRTISGQTPPG